jgi:hypothetical protein
MLHKQTILEAVLNLDIFATQLRNKIRYDIEGQNKVDSVLIFH